MIDLSKFCGIGDLRYWMNKPFSLDQLEGTFATNGHVLVWQYGQSDQPKTSALAAVQETFRRLAQDAHQASTDSKAWTRADSVVLVASTCKHCDGLGRLRMCEDCDGEGAFDHGLHEYDCKECNGRGHLPSSEGHNTCCICYGSGKAFSSSEPTPFGIDDACLSQRTLALIQLLPNAEIGSISSSGAFFRFDGGVGVAMLMRHHNWSKEFQGQVSLAQAGGGA